MLSEKLFGTDGIRGTANQYPITAEIAMKMAMAAGAMFKTDTHRNRVVIAKDTRLSGYMIEPALTSGFISVGMDVILVGPMPTPAVPMLMRSLRADLGVMISASHNPHHDNGLKLFDRNGCKLHDDLESTLQSVMLSDNLHNYLVKAEDLGRAKRLDDAQGRYVEFVKRAFPKNLSLSGKRIVLDCANGAAYKLAPSIFWELEAEVITIGCQPDGFNINDKCGSTNPQALQAKVRETGADIGIALDGDADRVILCDEHGQLIAGDYVIAAISKLLLDDGRLGGGVVITQMSNQALEDYLHAQGIKTWRTQVGDRYVFEAMRGHCCNLGGEPSGHVINSEYSTTGDGIITALQVLAYLLLQRQPASALQQFFTQYPQVHHNLPVAESKSLDNNTVRRGIQSIVLQNPQARILVRRSGTEAIIRITAEDRQQSTAEKIVQQLVDLLSSTPATA